MSTGPHPGGEHMVTSVVLALASPSDAEPPWALAVGGQPVLVRLVDQLQAHGRVIVLAVEHVWARARLDLPTTVELVLVDDIARAAAWFHDAPDDVLVIDAGIVTADLAIERVADRAAAGTWVLSRPLDEARGGLARIARGEVTGATSAYHRLSHASHAIGGAFRIGPRAASTLRQCAIDVGRLLETVPADLEAELHRKIAVGDLGAPGHTPPVASASELRDDLVSLLVVALVRAGVRMRATALPRAVPWRRPRDRDEALAAVAEVEQTDEERVRLDASVKDEDGFFTTFFVSTYSRYWARWCARHGFRPDHVTIASMILGLLAGAAFATGERWGFVSGALLLQLAFTLDCVDGQLARYTRHFSGTGAWLDSIFDRGKEYVVYAGLAIGGVRAGSDATVWSLAAVALTIQVFRHMLDFGYAARQLEDLRPAVTQPLDVVDEAGVSHWEAVETPPATGAGPAGARRLAHGAIRTLRVAEDIGPMKWAKRIVVLPIGERFAVISLVTAFVHPSATFWVLIVWGGLATAYTFGGRLVRSVT